MKLALCSCILKSNDPVSVTYLAWGRTCFFFFFLSSLWCYWFYPQRWSWCMVMSSSSVMLGNFRNHGLVLVMLSRFLTVSLLCFCWSRGPVSSHIQLGNGSWFGSVSEVKELMSLFYEWSILRAVSHSLTKMTNMCEVFL